jgi:hypothetical protein
MRMLTPAAGGVRRRAALASSLICLLVLAAGCLTVDATLDADGSATIDMTYPTQPGTKEETEKARLQSDHVKLESFETLKKNRARAKVKVDDVTKLSSAALFKDVTVTLTK